jgi:hypothetical protein
MPPYANRSGYHQLSVRLNKFPQGAPPSTALYDILSLLFTENEARLVSQLPIRVFNARKAAAIWGKPLAETRRLLNTLCRKALLVDIRQNGETAYCLPPPMAGFFEFSMMRRAQRYRSENPGGTVLPLHQHRGRFCCGTVCPGSDPFRPRLRQRGTAAGRLRCGSIGV